MFLRSLTMKGFKSFADPTVLIFEPGVTVVVGPNGSGKSNVVDAVTWVLGAQGPRQLRSAKMEDVIFAGTASRSALGRAEVSLTIDNADGALPIESAEVTITRTLFRNGDSEYALNGTPCRLLDIQELLSDTGIGRSQHMIIGQGQLDAVLQATPENRRAIIEEAAGVLKHRRRRERAERRLAQTQENLERLGDLVREVRRQMRPLERQAVAARSHASLATDLREVRVYLAGLELTELTTKKAESERGAAAAASDEAAVRAELDQLDAEASTTAAELSSRREEDLAGALGQIQGLAERARGTARVIVERQRAVVAALEASADVDVVSTLEAEVARLEAALGELAHDSASLEPSRGAVAAAEAALAAHDGSVDEAALLAAVRQASSSRAQAGARVAELERLVQDRRRGIEAARQRLAQAEARVARRTEADAALSARLEAAQANGAGLEQAAMGAQQALEAAEAALGAADQLATEAAEQAHRAQARAEALERALAELDGAAGRDALRGLAGVVGALVELVEIDEGWERAVEAAAGASVGAVVVEGRDAARAALSQLRELGTSGLVLTPSRAEATTARGALGGSAQPLRPHIRPRSGAPAQVGAVLDALFDRAVLVEVLDEAIELSLDRPDLVVVTAAGDRFSTSGWRVHSSTGVVTQAAVEQAQLHAEQARAATSAATAQRSAARSAVEIARADQREAARALDRHQAELDGAQRELAGGASDRHAATQAVLQATDELEAAQVGLGEVEADLEAARGALPDLDASLAAAEADAARAREQAASLDAERRSVNQLRRDLAVKEAELAERERVLEDRRRQIERRLEGHAVEREQAARRRERLERDGRVLARLKELVDAESDRLTAVLERLQGEYRTQVDAVRAGGERLERLRQKRAQLERSVAEISERLRNLEVETAEVGLKLAALVEHIERELGSTTTVVLGASCPELPAGVTAEAHAANLHAKLQSLGPINPLALEELSSLEERHRELDTQVADVRSARRELQEVVRTLDEEIVTTFAAAAADVNEHFSTLVAMLFPGGTGRLILTDPDDLLNTGVEIEVRPMGRNVRRVSLLSGGERSMAALAFSFAIFRSRPSPFYLMDEVEAALDDVNLHRFLGLVEEFRDEAQLIIVSHQKRTMETGDALYGVTMAPGGSSQVVSQKVLRERDPEPA